MTEDLHQKKTVVVGRVRKPHGVGGEVAIEVLSDVPDRFAAGRELLLRPAGGPSRPVRVVATRGHGEVLIVRLDGYSSRQAVESLRGALLEVERAVVPSAPDGTYYEYELTGCVLHDESAGELGVVMDVITDGGGWLLEVGRGSKRLLVPFVKAYLKRVDVEAGRIEVDLPDDLVELCTSTS